MRRVIGVLATAVVWAASALLPVPVRYGVWAIALIIDIANSWLPSHSTAQLPPGAAHFPERFGLLTIILLGEFVASVMRGIESQMGWSFLAASAAVLSLVLGFAIWSCYSDGARGWEGRHVRSKRDVVRLRTWIALHYVLFLGIGALGVGARRAIGLPPGAHFNSIEQLIICSATAGIMLVIIGIAATSEHHAGSHRFSIWMGQFVVALIILGLALLTSQIIATALLVVLLFAFGVQTMLLLINQRADAIAQV